MPDIVVLLSVPALRRGDLAQMPRLGRMAAEGDLATLVPSFPAVTCPVQANMTTGRLPMDHGVVANGFYWRERHEVEMWTAWNDCILEPQIWDILHEKRPGTTSAVWFALHSKGCGADYLCTPAPIHQPDGSEALWCLTKPEGLYQELVARWDHFPLQHFWGPLANIHSTAWIVDSAVQAAAQLRPEFWYLYLPHLDYAAQKFGPESDWARAALEALDEQLGRLQAGFAAAYPDSRILWIVASEYTIVPVRHALFPNRLLREAGLLAVRDQAGREHLDLAGSAAWALVDHQLAHVFVRGADQSVTNRVVDLFRGRRGVAEVLAGDERRRYDLDHPRSGEVVLVSEPDSWQAYYWWFDNQRAPEFARRVDIHNKPGYDPLEMHLDLEAMGISLDTSLAAGSHGAPARESSQRGIIVASERGVFAGPTMADIDVCELVLRQFGV